MGGRSGRSCPEAHRVAGEGDQPVTERLTESPRPSRLTLSGSPFPPIAEYGFLSDCEVSALIAASGNLEWMCERLNASASAPPGLDPHLETAVPAASDEAEAAP